MAVCEKTPQELIDRLQKGPGSALVDIFIEQTDPGRLKTVLANFREHSTGLKPQVFPHEVVFGSLKGEPGFPLVMSLRRKICDNVVLNLIYGDFSQILEHHPELSFPAYDNLHNLRGFVGIDEPCSEDDCGHAHLIFSASSTYGENQQGFPYITAHIFPCDLDVGVFGLNERIWETVNQVLALGRPKPKI